MKEWYFDLPAFKPEIGCEFQFTGGPDEEHQYVHLCKVTESIVNKKIAYSWSYQGYEGYSVVYFELFEEGDKTRLKLTHEGLESFPAANPHFAKDNFVQGWTMITGTLLTDYLAGIQQK